MLIHHLPPKIPLSAKFGLYFGHFAELPTVEEFFRFKTLATEWALRIQMLDISSVISALEETHHLVIEIPLLLALADDINPCFAYPIAINGYVANAQKPSLSSAHIYFKDRQGRFYPFKFETIERIREDLQSICYCYTKAQIVHGYNLYALPQNKRYENKLFLFLPDIQAPSLVKVFVQHLIYSHQEVQRLEVNFSLF